MREMQAEVSRLAEQLGEKDAAIEKLQREKASLENRKVRLEETIRAYQGEEPAPYQLMPVSRSLDALGLRDAIREVLGRGGRWKPAALLQELEMGGFQMQQGKTPANLRISNELWKMAKLGHLRKFREGYALP